MSQYSRYPVVTGGGGGSGTVTSVALAAPVAVFAVSGSPVTTSGTLTLAFQTQTANSVFAGPTTGSAAAPTFRALVAADLPAGTGTVTSVALALPVAVFTISGSPVTTSGTLTGSFSTQTANRFFAGPTSGGAATPTFRAIVTGDLPTSGIITLSAIGSTPNANAATLTGNALNLEPASASFGGVVTTTTQSFAGGKTFLSPIGVGSAAISGSVIYSSSDTSSGNIAIISDGYGTGTISHRARRARGTAGAPTAVQTDDILGTYGALGYGATGFAALNNAAIRFFAAQNFTDTAYGTYLTLNTVANNATTLSERMRIGNNGSVLIATSTDDGVNKLQVSGSIAAKTSLQLNGATSGSVTIAATATPTTYTVVLPSAQGAAGSYPQNDGSGNLTWSLIGSNIDGGTASSVYTASQVITGGTP